MLLKLTNDPETCRKLAASLLSLNKTEGDELLRISQEFPPPEDEVLDFCDAVGCDGLVSIAIQNQCFLL